MWSNFGVSFYLWSDLKEKQVKRIDLYPLASGRVRVDLGQVVIVDPDTGSGTC